MAEWIKPLGILAWSMVFLAALSGMYGFKLHMGVKHHKILAGAGIVLASIHAGLVLYLF